MPGIRSGSRLLAAIALACLCAAPLVAVRAAPKKPSSPSDAFEQLFGPVEEAMGIDIKAGKMKMNLLSGQVSVPLISGTHPTQGKFGIAEGVRFPFGAVIGASDPKKASVSVDALRIDLDFDGDRFWKVVPPGPGHIPGTPSLDLGHLAIGKGRLKLNDGKNSMKLTGFSGAVKNLALPGKIWSRGTVPKGRWAEASIDGGKLKYSGHPFSIAVARGAFHFVSSRFHIDELVGTLSTGGDVSFEGTVDMAGGRPSGYDVTLALTRARISRPNLSALATGTLALKGKPGKIKLSGKLALEDVESLEATKWSVIPCSGKIFLDISLLPEKGSKIKKAKIKGTTCKGRITLK